MSEQASAVSDLAPGARLLFYGLRDLADNDGRVTVASIALPESIGWRNRTSLRRGTHELEDARVASIERTTRLDGGPATNVYVLDGDDHR